MDELAGVLCRPSFRWLQPVSHIPNRKQGRILRSDSGPCVFWKPQSWSPALCTFLTEYVGAQLLGHVQLSVTPWIMACQAPLPMGLFRQDTGGDCQSSFRGSSKPRTEPTSPALAHGFFTSAQLWYPIMLSVGGQTNGDWGRGKHQLWNHTDLDLNFL